MVPGMAAPRSVGEPGAWQGDHAARGGAEAAAQPRDAPTTTDGHSREVHLLSGIATQLGKKMRGKWCEPGPAEAFTEAVGR